ncbi:MAG: hypothetical protein A2252_01945 [Elusimicrobia bacterium RIFOXYA2_FULL_39_19]|nr:MAG: hypothetical protein A2252_01945 [Elusimicrobia bacterium RIFOXYA2_FULL_39_19]
MKEYLQKKLCDMISISSFSGYEEKIASYIYNELKKNNVKVKKDTTGNVLAFVGKGKKRLIINGHMDTVDIVDGWKTNPLKPKITGGRIYGLGASDMKSGLAVMLYLAQNIKPNIEVIFAFTVCEEGSTIPGKINGVKKLIEKYRADYAITCESSVFKNKLSLCIGCQGRAVADIAVHGKAVHSSRFEMGKNAIYEAGKIVEKVNKYGKSLKPVRVYKQCFIKPSISVVAIEGEGGKTRNIIPDLCKVYIDRRLSVGENLNTFKKEVADFTANINCETKFVHTCNAVVTDFSGKLYNTAVKSFREKYNNENLYFSRGRLDLSYFAQKGMDILNIGPGLSDQAHSANEHCRISDMKNCVDLLKDIIESM